MEGAWLLPLPSAWLGMCLALPAILAMQLTVLSMSGVTPDRASALSFPALHGQKHERLKTRGETGACQEFSPAVSILRTNPSQPILRAI